MTGRLRVSAKTKVAALSSPAAIAIRNPEEETCFLEATREFGPGAQVGTQGLAVPLVFCAGAPGFQQRTVQRGDRLAVFGSHAAPG